MTDGQSLWFLPFRLDLVNQELWRETERLTVRPKPFAVLKYLIEQAGRLVPQAELRKAVWPATYVSEGMLRDYIRDLRAVLGDDAETPRFIETVYGRGYRFLPTVTSTPPVVSSQYPVASRKLSESAPLQLATEHSQLATRLVGRAAELAQLHQWLEKAQNGERQIVFVTGEAGIGKTTLVDAFVEEVQSPKPVLSPSTTLRIDSVEGSKVHSQKIEDSELRTPNFACLIGRGQCIEHYGTGEAYLPILDALGQLCREPEGQRLREVLDQYAPTWLAQMPALVGPSELEALQRKVAGSSKERMLREMAEALEALTGGGAHAPLLILILEDLHWSDVSTLDLLAFLARRRSSARLLVVGTYRPVDVIVYGHPLAAVKQELQQHGQCAEVELGLLSAGEVSQYLAVRFPAPSPALASEACPEPSRRGWGEGLSAAPLHPLARAIHQRTDGNPLFMVNVVDDLVTQGMFDAAPGQSEEMDESTALRNAVHKRIPQSLQRMIEQQIERLSVEEQRMLEAASVAGMEFSAAAVAVAIETDVVQVEEGCAGLARSGHFVRPAGLSEWPDGTVAARYSFLHALYQSVLYHRAAAGRRLRLHQRIGEREEAGYGDRVGEIAAELAVHFERGRDYRRAVHYLQQAAEKALGRSAHQEAITLLSKGLDLLQTLPATPERIQQELSLQTALSTPLMVTKGYAAPEVEKVYARARELCQQGGDTLQLSAVLRGQWRFYITRAQYYTARELGEQLLSLAQRVQDPDLLLEGHQALGLILLQMGALAPAQQHLAQGLALFDSQPQRPQVVSAGQDSRMTCLSAESHTLWLLGYPDQALQKSQEALRLGRALAHPHSLAFALSFAAWFHHCRGDWPIVHARAEELMVLATAQDFALWAAQGSLWQGWLLSEHGYGEEGLAQIRNTILPWQATGAKLGLPFYLSVLAQAHGQVGQTTEGLSVVAEALTKVHSTEERYWEAELWRLKGELTLQRLPVASCQLPVQENQKAKGKNQKAKITNPQAEAEAEACFQQAIEVARSQQGKSLELRAVMSMSRLLYVQGKQKQARTRLAQVYEWFTEGFDTADLRAAKTLLEEWSK